MPELHTSGRLSKKVQGQTQQLGAQTNKVGAVHDKYETVQGNVGEVSASAAAMIMSVFNAAAILRGIAEQELAAAKDIKDTGEHIAGTTGSSRTTAVADAGPALVEAAEGQTERGSLAERYAGWLEALGAQLVTAKNDMIDKEIAPFIGQSVTAVETQMGEMGKYNKSLTDYYGRT